jgi:hypothetical protein
METPCVIQILSKSHNVVLTAVVDYKDVVEAENKLEPLCIMRGYTIKSFAAHSLASVQRILEDSKS